MPLPDKKGYLVSAPPKRKKGRPGGGANPARFRGQGKFLWDQFSAVR